MEKVDIIIRRCEAYLICRHDVVARYSQFCGDVVRNLLIKVQARH